MKLFIKVFLMLVFSFGAYAQYPSCGNDHQINQDDIDQIIQKYKEYRRRNYAGSQEAYFASDFYKEDVQKISKLIKKAYQHEKYLLEELAFTNQEKGVPGVLCSNIVSVRLNPKENFKKFTNVTVVKDEEQTKVHAIEKNEFDFISPKFTKHIDMSDSDFGSGQAYKVN